MKMGKWRGRHAVLWLSLLSLLVLLTCQFLVNRNGGQDPPAVPTDVKQVTKPLSSEEQQVPNHELQAPNAEGIAGVRR